MNTLTKSQLEDALWKVLEYAKDDKMLETMCQACEN